MKFALYTHPRSIMVKNELTWLYSSQITYQVVDLIILAYSKGLFFWFDHLKPTLLGTWYIIKSAIMINKIHMHVESAFSKKFK